MATQVVGVEADVANCDFGLMGAQSRFSLRETVRLQHVEHGGLAGIVEAKEFDVGRLLEEAHRFHCSLEEVHDKNFLF